MRSTISMMTAKAGYIVISALLCITGIILIINPGLSVAVIGTIIGILMILFGIFKIVGYYSKDLFRLAFQYDLAFGALLCLLGIIVLMRPQSVMNFVCIATGIFVLADALFKIQMSSDAKQFGLNKWWLILIIAVIAGIIGLILVLRPSESSGILITILGISLTAEGVLNLITVLTAVKIVKHQQPDTVYINDKKE